MHFSVTVITAAALSTSALAQTTPNATILFGAGPMDYTVVTGAPYSAEGVSQNVQTLADGTHISGKPSFWKFYRDSAGRIRREDPVRTTEPTAEPATEPVKVSILIFDPVAHFKYTLDTANKVAHRTPFTAPATAAATAPRSTRGEQHQPPESLGKQTIEGIVCEGTRNTTIWPIGTRGNDRPVSIVNEIWTSPELHLILLHVLKNPQTGERTQKLLNISRAEPSAALFQPPADFTMVDDPASNGQISADGVFRPGGDVSAPALISKVEPQYSPEARDAKLSGSVLLSLVVGEDGVPRDIRIIRPLGLGLDEKAVEAVMAWRFQPGMKDGRPVPVRAQVQVNFRLLTKKQ